MTKYRNNVISKTKCIFFTLQVFLLLVCHVHISAKEVFIPDSIAIENPKKLQRVFYNNSQEYTNIVQYANNQFVLDLQSCTSWLATGKNVVEIENKGMKIAVTVEDGLDVLGIVEDITKCEFSFKRLIGMTNLQISQDVNASVLKLVTAGGLSEVNEIIEQWIFYNNLDFSPEKSVGVTISYYYHSDESKSNVNNFTKQQRIFIDAVIKDVFDLYLNVLHKGEQDSGK